MGIRNRVNNEYVGARDWARNDGMDRVNSLDDRVQAFGRQTYTDAAELVGDRLGGYPRGGLEFVRDIVHADRSQYTNDAAGKISMFGSRALQAGGMTAAGASLIDLSIRMGETFGGPADYQEQNSLPM